MTIEQMIKVLVEEHPSHNWEFYEFSEMEEDVVIFYCSECSYRTCKFIGYNETPYSMGESILLQQCSITPSCEEYKMRTALE